MKISITKRLVQNLFDNDDQSELIIENNQIGGSNKNFETVDDYDENLSLNNDFDVKNVQNFEFNLQNNSTFSLDVLSLLKGDIKTVSFIEIWCVESTGLTRTPVRFDLELARSGGIVIPLGRLSAFSLTNIKNLLLKNLTVSNILIKSELTATLFVSLGTSDKFSS